MGKNSNFAVVVAMSDSDAIKLGALISGDAPVVEKLGRLASEHLKSLAAGGASIPPEWAIRVKAAIGTLEHEAIVAAVEKSVGRQGDSIVVPWVVDPTQIAFYDSLAESAGITREQQLKSLMDFAYSQGWFGMGAPDPFKLLLTQAQYRWLQQLFEKDNVTGEDVVEKLRRSGAIPTHIAEDDDDPVMASLRGE
jgi:hypothetical protein